jgi:sugar-specific transcriptional regulator TrmB
MYVPVPPSEVLSQFERRSSSMLKRVGNVFKHIDCSDSPPAPSLYNLENTSQVLSRSVTLIEKAETSLSLTSDRFPLLHLSAYLAEASRRGVNVLVNSYAPIDIPGCDCICWERRQERERLPGNLIMMAVDGREMVSAFFTPENRVISAFWINNPYIVTILHHGRSADTILARILNLLKQDITMEEFSGTILELTNKHIYTIPHKSLFETMTEESHEEHQSDL